MTLATNETATSETTPLEPPTPEQRRTTDDGLSTIDTPRIRTVFRRLLFWIGAALILAIIVLVIFAAAGSAPSAGLLSATNSKPNGAKALLQVLRADGVSVQAPRTLKAAISDVAATSVPTTLVVYDRNGILDRARLEELSGIAPSIVLIEPSFAALQALDPDISSAGFVPSTATADCNLPAAVRAGRVSGLGRGYRVASDTDATECFGTAGSHSLIVDPYNGGTVTVVGSATIFTNGAITRSGNAALALGILGATPHTVWYLPSLADYPTPKADGVIPLPPWVGLLETLVVLVALAAAFWRGRRLGPIVVERLPVIVRSSETVEGRARLYQKASSRTHALDILRIGTLRRLATLCGLSRRASLDDVIGAVATATGRPLPELRALLVDDIPGSDSALIRASDDLLQLERDVAQRTRPA